MDLMLSGSILASRFRLSVLGRGEVAGRPCWKGSAAVRDPGLDARGSIVPRLHLPRNRVDAWVDCGTGVLVRLAFERILQRGDEGDGLSNVHGGENLAEPLDVAQRQMPSPEDVAVTVESIMFVRPDEAVVGFSEPRW